MMGYFKLLKTTALAILIALPLAAGASGSHSTVNKSIKIGDNATIGNVDSVNGAIRIGDNSFVKSIDAVNGSIKLGSDVAVDKGIDAVNGSISLEPGCEVGGNIESVNGSIKMANTSVAGYIETYNGKLRILEGSEVAGNVMVRKSKGWGSKDRRKPVYVEIGEDVVIHGDLIFEHAVELNLHDTARVGEIIGDEVVLVGSS